jgi:hypothetical protein
MNIAIVQPYENVGIEEYGLVNCSTSTFDLEIETAWKAVHYSIYN